MPIITDNLKKRIIEDIETDINDSDSNYYIGIGRSQDWDSDDTVVTAINSELTVRDFQNNLQSIKNVENFSRVIPRTNWTAGAIYSGYDDNVVGYPAQNFYVLTDTNSVYICLRQSRNNSGQAQISSVKPTGNSEDIFETSDGYIWKFLYSISALTATRFLAANFMPVKLQGAVDSDSSITDIEQNTIQNAAIDGQITSIAITNSGSGYTSAPSVSIFGDGSSATATATISGGGISKVDINVADSDGSYRAGAGYSFANIEFVGGGGANATARAILSPNNGFGADPRNDLKSSGIMLSTRTIGTENLDFIINNDFRQVGLIRNPLIYDSDGLFNEQTGIALRSLTVAPTTAFTTDNILVGTPSGAEAYIDKIDSDRIYYHQSNDTGFKSFTTSDALTEQNGNGAGTVISLDSAEVDAISGEVLYIDNRAAVTRSSEQTEDIKLVIQL